MSEGERAAATGEQPEMVLRRLVWLGHATSGDGHGLYGDDGEMQCTGRDGYCDFRRQSVEDIERHITARGFRLFSGAPREPEPPARPTPALTEQRIRDGLAKLEDSILHHEIERDGWTPQDECYQKLVAEFVADLLRAVGR